MCATCVLSFNREPPIFINGAKYVSASRGIHVACFSFVFHLGRLAVPRLRHDLEARRFFLRRSGECAGLAQGLLRVE